MTVLGQPQKSTFTLEVPEERLCSFCYSCGKEFETYQFESHQCHTNYFDISDNNGGAQESPADDDDDAGIAEASTHNKLVEGSQIVKQDASRNVARSSKLAEIVKKRTQKAAATSLSSQHVDSIQDVRLNQPSTAKLDNNKPISRQSDYQQKTHIGRSNENVDKGYSLLDAATSSSDNTAVQSTSSFQEITPPKATFCEFCGLQMPNLKNLKIHQLTVHVNEQFLCLICGETFNVTSELMFHQKITHYDSDARKAELDSFNNTSGRAKSKYRYYCNQCGQGFDFTHSLLSHKKEFITLGSHFLEDGVKALGVSSEKKQTKNAKGEKEKRKKIIDESTGEKNKTKAKCDVDNLSKNRKIDDKASKLTEQTSKNKKSNKDQSCSENRNEMRVATPSKHKAKKEDNINISHTSEKESNADIETQKQTHIKNTEKHKKIEENVQLIGKQNNKSTPNTSLKYSESRDKTSKANEKQIPVKHQSKSQEKSLIIPLIKTYKKQDKHKLSNAFEEENNTVIDVQKQQDYQIIEKHKEIRESQKETTAKRGDNISRYGEGCSKNDNTSEQEEIYVKSSSTREKESNNSQKQNKQGSKNKNIQQRCIEKKVLKPKDFQMKPFRVLLTLEKLQITISKVTHKSNEINKLNIKTDKDEKKKLSDESDDNISNKKEAIAKIRQIKDKRKENTIISEATNSKAMNTLKKPVDINKTNDKQDKNQIKDILKIPERINTIISEATNSKAMNTLKKTVDINKTNDKHDKNQIKDTLKIPERINTIISEATNSKAMNTLKKTVDINKTNDKHDKNQIKDTLKIPERIIKDCDIFGFHENIVTQPKKDLKQVVAKSNNVDKKSRGECGVFGFHENIVTQPKTDLKQVVAKSNNVDKESREIEQERKKRLSLQQYKQIRNNVPNPPSVGTTPLIIARPQISAQAMDIINEVTQKIEIYNTLQHQKNSNNAQFSDDAESNSGSSQETLTDVFCEACGSNCLNSDHLRDHMAFMHQGFHFTCFVCDHRFSSLDALIGHQVKYPKDMLVTAESQFLRLRKSIPNMLYPYYCNQCGKGFTLIDLVAIHKKQKHDKQGKRKAEKGASKIKQFTNPTTEGERPGDITSVQQQSSTRNNLEVNEDQAKIATGNNDCQKSDNTLDDNINNGSNMDQEINSLNKMRSSSANRLEDINGQCLRDDPLEILRCPDSMNDKHDEAVANSSSHVPETTCEDIADPNFPRFCESCGRKHLSREDQQKDLHLEKFKCIICRSPYETIDLLVTHYDRRHPKHEVANFEYAQRSIQKKCCYHCKFCGKGFYFIGELLEHKECDHSELLQQEKEKRSTAKNREKSSGITQIGKQDIIEGNQQDDNLKNVDNLNLILTAPTVDITNTSFDEESTVTNKALKGTTLDSNKGSFSDIMCKDVQNVNQIQKNDNVTITIDLSDIPDVNSDKNATKNDNLINVLNLSNISNISSNSNNLIIDLDDINSSGDPEEDDLSNFVDVEEFMREQQTKTPEKPENVKNKESEAVDFNDFSGNPENYIWDEAAKQLVDEVSLMEEENLLGNSPEKTTQPVVGQMSPVTEENGLQDCHEEHVTRQLVDKLPLRSENDLHRKEIVAEPVSTKVLSMAKDNILKNCHEDVVKSSSSIHVPLDNTNLEKETTCSFCEACGQRFPNKTFVKYHFIDNHRPFRCSVCDKRFTFLSKLIKHQDLKYQLSNLQYAENYSLRLLLMKETPEHFRYYCNMCGKGMNLIYELKAHKNFNCPRANVGTLLDSSSEAIASETSKYIVSPTNIPEKQGLDVPYSSETPGECTLKNETLLCTAQTRGINLKGNIVPNANILSPTSTLTETKNAPICNTCGESFLYWRLLNEHRVLGCASEKPQDIKSIKEEEMSSCTMHLGCQKNEAANKVKESRPLARKHFCLGCGKGFLYSNELDEHKLKECPSLNSTFTCNELVDPPQSLPETSKVSFSLHLPKTMVEGSSINIEQSFSTTSKTNVTFPARTSLETFKCPICPHRVFAWEKALKQHMTFSQKHIKLMDQKNKSFGSQTSSNDRTSSLSQIRNLPLTSSIGEADRLTRNQTWLRSSSHPEVQEKDLERWGASSRPRSRSPPRSRMRTKLSDLRRRSIKREVELKESKDKKKKKRKRGKKRRREISENEEHEVKKSKKASSALMSKTKTLKYHRKIKSSSSNSSTRNKSYHAKTGTKVNIGEKKKDNNVDDLDGIYTLEELKKMYP